MEEQGRKSKRHQDLRLELSADVKGADPQFVQADGAEKL